MHVYAISNKAVGKISGPILDRFDLFVCLSNLETSEIMGNSRGQSTSSHTILDKVLGARLIQHARYKDLRIFTNSEIGNIEVNKYCTLNRETMTVVGRAISKLDLSPRAYFKVMKISRTIADLDKSLNIMPNHALEALQFRQLWGR
jgi:magnesium chelatase family protein